MSRRTILAFLVAAGLAIAATPAIADKGGNGNRRSDPSCRISPNPAAVGQPYNLSAIGLPTTDPVWLIVQPPSGYSTVAQAYVSSDGSWSGTEFGNQAGTWTYTFSGLMTNNKYGTVASCSVQAN